MADFTIKGNPAGIRSRAVTMSEKGQLFYDTGEALAKIDTSGWTGRAADQFREAHDLEPERWTKAGNGFKRAAAALSTYADELADAQAVADWAREEHARGETESQKAEGAFSWYMDQMRSYWASGGTDPAEPYVDPGAAIRDHAISEFNAAKADLDNAAHLCAGQVRAGCADAPEEPEWWESGLRFVGGIFEGAGEAVWDLLTMVPFSPVNLVIDSYNLATGDITPEELKKKYELAGESAVDMAQGIYQGLRDDPVEFGKTLGKSLLDWDTWADDPARALGHLVPDAVAAALTAGTGAVATRGVKGGMDVLDGLGDLNKLDNLADLNKLDELGDLRRLDNLPDDIRDLVDRPVGSLAPHEIDALREARDAITAAPGTPMQRVISPDQVADYVRGSSSNPHFQVDQTYGYTARHEDVAGLRTPQEMFDGLGLDYDTTPYRADGDTSGPNQGGKAVDEIHYLRYEQVSEDIVVPRHSDLGGSGRFDADATAPDNPFTGNGYTSGGVPEFHTGRPADLGPGAEIWQADASGNQHLVATMVEVDGKLSWLAVPR
ncbi:WXG100 family type VII secretion target [Nocardioides sp.]|uniref:WXG100 family type VII secretion target n=1 Tax=Nocardioides sp. TaxID=35761 RepID=UPI002BA2610F|nr:hypothetical protein [Nocardioides sp.]HXH80007.1 hypothetical protein [Nocardioides sp.]